MKKIIIFLSILLCSFSKTIFLYEHIRHSHRSPDFKNEKYKRFHRDMFNIQWKTSGLLTKIGKRSAFLQGYRTRIYYQHFLPEFFIQNQIFCFSTPAKRVIQGIQAQMIGLFYVKNNDYHIDLSKAYPPGFKHNSIDAVVNSFGDNVLMKNVDILPFDIISEEELDYFFLRSNICSGIKEIKKQNLKDKIFDQLYNRYINEYGDNLKRFFNKSNTDFLKDFSFVNKMSDIYITGYENNRFNNELKEKYNIDLRQFYKLNKEFQYNSLYKRELNFDLSRIALYKTLPQILKWMDNRVQIEITGKETLNDYENGEPRYVLFAGHANTVGAFVVFLNKLFGSEIVYPEFTSHFFFDLYRDENFNNTIENYYVKFIFDDHILFEVDYLTFKKKIQNNMITEKGIKTYCNVNEKKLSYINLGIILIIFVAIIVFVNCKMMNKNKRKNKKKENMIEMTEEDQLD